jgi:glycosyltransferase involved in cell wall biosynthesis
MQPLISIIIPCHNKIQFIEQTINSIIQQSYLSWELLLIDDCSTDGTYEVTEAYAAQYDRIILIHNSVNKGANYSRNKGAKMAKGDFILFFDADDLMLENCLLNRVEYLKSNIQFDLMVFNMGVFKYEVGDQPSKMNWILPLKDVNYLNSFLKHQIPWSTPQVLWKKNGFKKLGGFNLNYSRLQDVELHTRALLAGYEVITYPNSNLDIYYRIDEKRISFDLEIFNRKFVSSCIMYYRDFINELKDKKNKKLLIGTLFEALSNISYQHRLKRISKSLLVELSDELIESCEYKNQKIILKIYSIMERISPFHPKGLKILFKQLLSLNK